MVAVSYLLHHHTKLKNAIDNLLQNAKKVYYKMLQPFYCKMQQLYFKTKKHLTVTTFSSFIFDLFMLLSEDFLERGGRRFKMEVYKC